jgi:hypothetical protein
MKNLLLILLHLAVVTAKLCGPGGVRAVIAENLLLRQQLIILRRARKRAPSRGRATGCSAGSDRSFSVQNASESSPLPYAPRH